MKRMNFRQKMRPAAIVVITAFCMLPLKGAGQKSETEKNIDNIRKGEIIIKARPKAKVQVEQTAHEFWFGCAIPNSLADGMMRETDKKQFQEKFLQNFNSAVTENAVKWGTMERQKGAIDYSVIDGILNWTEENNIPLRGHNLFWGIPKFIQPWVKELTDDELELAIRNRAETLTARYKGRFAEYDLNNEMVHGNYYEERLGPDITKKMAEWSINGDPEIKLWLNDYDILTGNKLPEYMAQIRSLLKQKVPVAGIGVQGHLHAETFDRHQLKNALDSLAQFNLPIRVTEFNIPGQRSKHYQERIFTLTDEEELQKATELVDYYTICFAHPAVDGIIMWGFWEGANWIPVSSLYKRDWSPTPAAEAYRNLIFKEWWTNAETKTNRKGELSVRAFFGKYKITVDGKMKEIDLPKEKGKVIVEF
ncbi:MAG TPA: endo-1,4-beta-xylanase [Prolixibacteraceae bacterium]|jgi:GH35 family endo-1,4-beta-xylanase|nr:glycoside hydrolase [Bacteroidales bacterium]HOC86722.1 endo-1,4-beta-xylanase [Prolixibacteraceae bacterium]HOG94641.1 endo-1,4-beta-xylanase [Prolixibacteraceae bacterium]HQL17875.1 endo-1,4-beta-xylanase [Prolixibacteraceae bacterium]